MVEGGVALGVYRKAASLKPVGIQEISMFHVIEPRLLFIVLLLLHGNTSELNSIYQ